MIDIFYNYHYQTIALFGVVGSTIIVISIITNRWQLAHLYITLTTLCLLFVQSENDLAISNMINGNIALVRLDLLPELSSIQRDEFARSLNFELASSASMNSIAKEAYWYGALYVAAMSLTVAVFGSRRKA